MPWESDAEHVQEKPARDWTRFLWGAVALVILAAIVLMLMPSDAPVVETQARVSHILITPAENTEAGAQEAFDVITHLREQVLSGESFAALAKTYSADEASARRGGDLGWRGRGELSEPIDEWIWTAPIGEVSEPIATGHGLHLVVVKDRQIADAERYELEFKERVLNEEND